MGSNKSITLEITEQQIDEIIKSLSSHSRIQKTFMGMGRVDVNDKKERQLLIDRNTKLIELLEKAK